MRVWTANVIRGVGVANILFSVLGVYFSIDSVLRSLRHGWAGHLEYEPSAFYVSTAINLVFLLFLFLAGLLLLRLDRRGTTLSYAVFLLEIAYFLGSAWLSLGLTLWGSKKAVLIGRSMGAVGGIGDMGIATQLVTGYPLVALVVLILARRHLDRRSGWAGSPDSPGLAQYP